MRSFGSNGEHVMDMHMWKLAMDSRMVSSFAREQGLLHREATDHGYVIHAALAALFGGAAPSPFVMESALSPEEGLTAHASPREIVLAYSPLSLDAARAKAAHGHMQLLRWEDCGSKTVPAIATGSKLAFTARVLPVVRSRAAAPGRSEHGRGEGRELDAFLAECARVGSDVRVERAAVYRDWLARRVASSETVEFGGAEIEDFSLAAFRRVRLLRKEAPSGHARKRHIIERPDALVTGTLRVSNEHAFRELLMRGIGRHRAFGFGMLLVRRAT
jgi:CRISPR system Cascade subunit CasE